MLQLLQFVARAIESVNRHLGRRVPEHLQTARRGEMEAYLYLRAEGYRLVATNLRVPQSRGEIDLIGWDDGILCFIEVKTRTGVGLTPPETAVDREKKGHILSVARRYVRRLPGNHPPPCRFDVVSIVLGEGNNTPDIHLHKGAFAWDADKPRRYEYFSSWSRSPRRSRK
jgi:putative endonuclease